MVDILNPTPLPFNTDTGQELYKVGRPGMSLVSLVSRGETASFHTHPWVVCGKGSLGGCLIDMPGMEGQPPVAEEAGPARSRAG